MLRLITIWPFCGEIVEEIAARDVRFLVPEMNLGQVADLVRAAPSVGRSRRSARSTARRSLPPASSQTIKEMV